MSSVTPEPALLAGRVAFVCGLHRSGTTPLTRWLCSHPSVSGLTGTGVPEDEGQFLQSLFPIGRRYGGPGRFALDSRAWLNERSDLVSAGAAAQLMEAWAPYWDTTKAVLLEKSPPNLVRLRFLRALFPDAPFVIVVRHPIAVALATEKFNRHSSLNLRDHLSFYTRIRHWVAAHGRVLEDARTVGRVTLLRYEDLMTDPDAMLQSLFGFLGLTPHAEPWSVSPQLNERYFHEFARLRRTVRGRIDIARLRGAEQAVRRFGYSVTDPTVLGELEPQLARLDPRRSVATSSAAPDDAASGA